MFRRLFEIVQSMVEWCIEFLRNAFEIIQALVEWLFYLLKTLVEWFFHLFKRNNEVEGRAAEPAVSAYAEREKEVARIIENRMPSLAPVLLRYDDGWRPASGSYREVKLQVPFTGAMIPVATFTNFHLTAEQEADEIIQGMASLRSRR